MKTEAQKFSWLDVPKAVWYFIAEDRKKFIIAFSILSVIFLYDFIPPYILGKIVDFFTNYKLGQPLSTFYFYIIFVSLTWIVAALTRNICRYFLSIYRHNARARARTWGFERLTEFSLEWHNKENTGNKLQRIFTGAEAVTNWMRIAQRDLVKIFVNTIGVIIFFSVVDFKLSILIVFYLIFFWYIEFYFSKRVYNLSNQFNRLNQSAGGVYVESASNMLSVKAMGREKEMLENVSQKEVFTRDMSIQKSAAANLKWRFLQVLNGISLGLFLYFIGSGVVSKLITIGMILVFYNYFERFLRNLGDISDLYLELIDLRSDLANMMPIFKETEFIKTGNAPFPKNWDRIELKNATMDYGSGQMGLRGLDLTLKRNTKTGVAGLSGSGKSTLAKIILGLYALKSGEFKVGDKNYYSISHNETLGHITVVLQETELFNLSLKDNITMMRGEDTGLLNMAVEVSQLKDVISKLPEGLDSMIGEKGYMLSGGERQRLGIARAIYKNGPIIILDEATSSLDSETEGKIMEKLLGEYGKDKTFLIIAHRLGTLKYTDNIAVMEAGKVVEEGSYDELMSNTASVFFRMNNMLGKT